MKLTKYKLADIGKVVTGKSPFLTPLIVKLNLTSG